MEETIKKLLQEVDEAREETKSLIEKEDDKKKREIHVRFLNVLERFAENTSSFVVLMMLHKVIKGD